MKSRNLFGSILVICGCYLYGLHTCEGFSLIRNSNPSSIHNVYNNFASQSSNRNDGARILSHLSGRGKLSALNMSKRSNEVQQALELIQELLQLADDAKGNPDMEKEVEKMLRAASAALDEAEKKELINKGPDRSDFISPLEMKQVAKDNYSRFSWAQGGANKPQQLRDGGDMPVQPRRWKDKYAGMKNRFQESRRLQNQARNDGIYMLPEASRRDINSDGAQVFPPPNDRESPRYLELREAQRQNELNLKQDRDRSSFQQQMGQTKQSESSVEGTSNMIRQNTYLSSDEKSSLDRPITTKPPSYLDKDSQFTSDNDASSYVSSPSPSNTNQSKPMPKWKQQTDQEKDKDDTAAADAMVGTTSYLQGFSKPPATANKEVSKPVPKWKKEASSPASAPASKGIGSFLNVFGGGSSSSTSSDSAKAFEQEEKKAKEKGQQTSPSATAPDTMASSGSYLDAFNKAPSPVSGSGVPAKPVPKWKQQTNQEKDKDNTAAADTMVGATSYLQGFNKPPSTANKTVSKPVPKWKKEASSPSSAPASGGAGSFLNAFGGGSSSSTSSDSAKAFEQGIEDNVNEEGVQSSSLTSDAMAGSGSYLDAFNKAPSPASGSGAPAKPVPKWKQQTDQEKDKDDTAAADAMVGTTSYLQGFSKPPATANKEVSKPVPKWKKEASSPASAPASKGIGSFLNVFGGGSSSFTSSDSAKAFEQEEKAKEKGQQTSPSATAPDTMAGSGSYLDASNKAPSPVSGSGAPAKPVPKWKEQTNQEKDKDDTAAADTMVGATSYLQGFNKPPSTANKAVSKPVPKWKKEASSPSSSPASGGAGSFLNAFGGGSSSSTSSDSAKAFEQGMEDNVNEEGVQSSSLTSDAMAEPRTYLDAFNKAPSPASGSGAPAKPAPKWKQQTDQEKDKDDTAAADAMVGTTSYLQGFSKPPATANKEVSKPVPKWKKEASSPASAPASKGIGSFLNVFGGGSSSSTTSDSAKAFEQEEKKAKEKGQQTSPSATAPDTMASSGSYLDAFNKAPSPVSGSGALAKPVPKWKQQTNQEKDKNDTAAADTMVGATSYLQGFSKSPSTANKTVSKPVPKWKKEASSPSSSPALGGAGSFLNAFGGGSSSSTSSDSAKAFEKAEKAKEQISPSATSSGENNKASTPAKPVPKWKEQTDKKKDKDDASAADAMVGATSYLQGFSKPPSGTNKAASKPVPIWKKEESSLASASAFDGANAFVDADSSPPTSSDISSEIAKGFMKRKAQGQTVSMKRKAQGQTVSQSPSISDPNTMDGSDSYRGQFNKALTSTGGPPVMTSDERISNAKSSKDNEKSSGLFGSFLDAFNKSPTVSNDSSDDIVRKSSKNVYEPSPSTKSESANDPEKSPSTNMQQANQATFRQVRDSKVKPKLDDPVQLREDSISESSEDDYGVEVFEMIQEIQEEAMLAAIGGIFVGLAPGLLYASYLYMNEFSLDVNTDVLPFIPAGSAAFFSLLSYRLSIPFGKTKSNDPLDYDTDFAMTIRLFLAAPFARIKLVLSGKYEKYRVIADERTKKVKAEIDLIPKRIASKAQDRYYNMLDDENDDERKRRR